MAFFSQTGNADKVVRSHTSTRLFKCCEKKIDKWWKKSQHWCLLGCIILTSISTVKIPSCSLPLDYPSKQGHKLGLEPNSYGVQLLAIQIPSKHEILSFKDRS